MLALVSGEQRARGAARTRRRAVLWLTDADIRHAPGVLPRLRATAARRGRDMVSVMARLRCDNAAEKLLIPAFTYFCATLYSFRATGDDRSCVAGAAAARRRLFGRNVGQSLWMVSALQ